jgi:hypothetical protein
MIQSDTVKSERDNLTIPDFARKQLMSSIHRIASRCSKAQNIVQTVMRELGCDTTSDTQVDKIAAKLIESHSV